VLVVLLQAIVVLTGPSVVVTVISLAAATVAAMPQPSLSGTQKVLQVSPILSSCTVLTAYDLETPMAVTKFVMICSRNKSRKLINVTTETDGLGL